MILEEGIHLSHVLNTYVVSRGGFIVMIQVWVTTKYVSHRGYLQFKFCPVILQYRRFDYPLSYLGHVTILGVVLFWIAIQKRSEMAENFSGAAVFLHCCRAQIWILITSPCSISASIYTKNFIFQQVIDIHLLKRSVRGIFEKMIFSLSTIVMHEGSILVWEYYKYANFEEQLSSKKDLRKLSSTDSGFWVVAKLCSMWEGNKAGGPHHF